MNSLLNFILPIIFATQPLTEKQPEKVMFSQLPRECVAEYDSFLREERKAVSTDVIKTDLDGDGINELLVWTGNGGSGGEEWSVMRYNGKKYIRAGQVFGQIFCIDSPHKGLLVCCSAGWTNATWSFYQIQSGKLYKTVELEVVYSQPIRRMPVEIKIKYDCGPQLQEGTK